MDDGDRARDWQQRQIEDALAAHRHKGGHPVPSRLDCEECGEEIPLARRRVVPGCRFCIDCQRKLELNKGRV
ncbi:TraR/DksA C4-type zinc finger protein [Pseudomonas sp.]|uniref:TraR/DksA C4-type zinc finger protein n=1 Tax=Pseudomonas sp. TaxID=306 RepID=UPI003D0B7F04